MDKQVSQVEDAITAGYDGVILHACSSSALLPAVKEAMAAGVKVITTHVPLDEDICPHIWEDPEGAGQDLAIDRRSHKQGVFRESERVRAFRGTVHLGRL